MKNNNVTILRFALIAMMLCGSSVFAARTVQSPEDKLLSRAFEAFMDGRNKTALGLFDEVIRLNPDNKAAQRGLKKVKNRLNKIDKQEQARAKNLAEAKYKEGKQFMNSDDVVGAIDSYPDALSAYPKHSKSEKALTKLKKKILRDLDKKNFSPSHYSFQRGVLAYLSKDWSKSFRIWSERSKIEPNNVALANAKARAENRFKKMMMAERKDFYRHSARTLYEQGYFVRAQESWEHVLELEAEDQEAIEGYARAEKEILRIEGKGRDDRFNNTFERALDLYANQKWNAAKREFIALQQLDPDFKAAQEYIARINRNITESQYTPQMVASADQGWRERKQSNQGSQALQMSDGSQNLTERRQQLESQLKRDPTNIKIQQELDKIINEQDQESERVYKDGLIVYSQGNRALAITKWKQVLIMNPDHKKASAALKKARAEEERSVSNEAP